MTKAGPVGGRNVVKQLCLIFGNVFFSVAQWVALWAIARCFSKDAVADFSLATATATVVFAVIGLQLRDIIYSRLDYVGNARRYLGVRVASCLLSTIVCYLIALLINLFSPNTVGTSTIVAISFMKSADAITEVVNAGDISIGRYDRFVSVQGAYMVFRCIGLLGGALVLKSYPATLWLSGAGSTVVTLAVVVRTELEDKLQPMVEGWYKKVLSGGTYLGIAVKMDSLAAAAPRFILDKSLGTGAVAEFTVAMVLYQGVGAALGLIGSQILIPRFSRLYNAEEHTKIRGLFRLSMVIDVALTLFVAAVCLLIGRPVISAIFGPSYAKAGSDLPITALVTGIWLGAGVVSCLTTGMRKYNIHVLANTGMLLAVSIAVLALAPLWGVAGALWAVGVGTAVRGMILYAFIRKDIGHKLPPLPGGPTEGLPDPPLPRMDVIEQGIS